MSIRTEPPCELRCPISLSLMNNPYKVIHSDSKSSTPMHVFEKLWIEEHLKVDSRCPLCRRHIQKIERDDATYQKIQAWKKKHPSVLTETNPPPEVESATIVRAWAYRSLDKLKDLKRKVEMLFSKTQKSSNRTDANQAPSWTNKLGKWCMLGSLFACIGVAIKVIFESQIHKIDS